MDYGISLFEECRRLSDKELLEQLEKLAARERGSLIRVLVRLSELQQRDLARKRGFPSVFIYCVRKLRYSEPAAFRRTKAAEACRRFPFLLELLEGGQLNLMAVALIAPHLTRQNSHTLARQARGKTTREIERLIAGFSPVTLPKERVRIIAVRKIGDLTSKNIELQKAQDQSQTSLPLAEETAITDAVSTTAPANPPELEIRSKRTFTCSEEVERMIARAMQLLWHKYPSARFEDILREALERLLDQIDPERRLSRLSPGKRRISDSRRVPKWIRDRVWKRDDGCCSFVGTDGMRCGERTGIEFDHIRPWALGGRSDDPDNIRLLCWAHNQSCARRQFGALVPRRPA